MFNPKTIRPEVRVAGCLEVVEQIGGYLRLELSEEEVGSFHRHLSGCERCSRRVAFEQTLLETVRAACRTGDKAPYALRERIHLLLNEEDRRQAKG